MSALALFISLGGGAYAALGPGSIGTRELKTGAVTRAKIRSSAIDRTKVAKHSLGLRQLDDGAIGNAVAFAEVTPTGIVKAHSRGIDNSNFFTAPAGLYCFRDLPAHRTVVATPVATAEHDRPILSVSLDPHSQGFCSTVEDATLAVVTENLSGNEQSYALEPFILTLFK